MEAKIMLTLKKISVVGAAVLMCLMVGCNTIRGVGEDVEEGGEAIQDTATDVQN
jgi:entericidin B